MVSVLNIQYVVVKYDHSVINLIRQEIPEQIVALLSLWLLAIYSNPG